MKALGTLLKVAKRDLETLRRALADAQARQGAVEQGVAALDARVAAERASVAGDALALLTFHAYAERMRVDRRVMIAEVALAAAECERLRALITAAHVETRKFERLIERERERERQAAAKREDAELDEMATMRAGRR